MKSAFIALALAAAAPIVEAQSASGFTLTPGVRSAVLDSVIGRVTAVYVDADTARLIANALRAKQQSHAYDAITNPAQFADIVTNDLRSVNNDLHLGLRYSPPGTESRPAASPLGDPRSLNFGMGRAEILDGNVGYLEITGFVGGSYRDAVVDALRFLSRTDAMIIDLRRNGGGASEMSHFIFSHFLSATPVPTIDVRTRASSTPRHGMSLGDVPGPRRTDVPLYILTSQGTASAAEEFTFVLKNQRRAQTVGDRTAGAGHMVSGVPIGNGFAVSLSITRVSDPTTGREWERVGVLPDIAVAPELALDAAHAAALRTIIAAHPDDGPTGNLRRMLATIDARITPVAIDANQLARTAGEYEGRVITVRDGRVWYARRAGAMPQALTPLAQNEFALGAARLKFNATGSGATLTIEQADGTFVVLKRN